MNFQKLIIAALVATLSSAAIAADRPNIVLILADDLGYETRWLLWRNVLRDTTA